MQGIAIFSDPLYKSLCLEHFQSFCLMLWWHSVSLQNAILEGKQNLESCDYHPNTQGNRNECRRLRSFKAASAPQLDRKFTVPLDYIRQSLVKIPTCRSARSKPIPALAAKRAHLLHGGCLSFSHKWYLKIHIFSSNSWALHFVMCFPFVSHDCRPFAQSLLPRFFYFWKTDFSTL